MVFSVDCGMLGRACNRAVWLQVLLENYLMLAAALENQNIGRMQDMLQYV